jgi:hypothetical protein
MDLAVAEGQARHALASARLITTGSNSGSTARAGGSTARGGGSIADSRPVVPVVMCVWNRLDRVVKVLRTVEQSLDVRAEVYLWNNRFDAGAELAAELQANAACIPRTTVANCAVNIGGFGRFYWARELAVHHPFVVFIDDDQVLDPFALRTLVDEHRARTLHAVWAFRFKNRSDYWSRQHLAGGAEAKYLGTGGMIADSSIFADDALFRCPGKYWFIEDVWLSYFAAAVYGWRLYRSHAEIGLMLDDLGQTRRLRELKNAFFRHLNKDPRWGDPSNANNGRLVPAQPRRPAEQRRARALSMADEGRGIRRT